jgi:hypothetical protein
VALIDGCNETTWYISAHVTRIARFFRLSDRELTIALLVFVLTLPAVTLRLYASDEVQYFSYLRSLYFDRDVSFENEYRYFAEAGTGSAGFADTFLVPPTDTGLRRNFGTMGSAILWSPFYAVGDAGVRIARLTGSTVPADGFSKPYIAAVCLGSAVYGFIALLLSARIARTVTGSGLRAAALVALGTPLIFYMYVAPGFAHATSAFAVALFITTWLTVRHGWSPKGVAALAAAGALMTMVREQDAFFVAGPIADFAIRLGRTMRDGRGAERRSMAGGAVVLGAIAAITFAIVVAPQFLAYKAINGRFGPSPLVGRKMIWTSPHALQVLLSPEHGFMFWTPLALVGLAGLVWFAVTADRDRAPVAAAMLIMFAAAVYITGCVDSWSSAGGFGQRRLVNLTPLLTVGVAVVLSRAAGAPARATATTCAALCVWWNLALIAQFGAHMMDRQRLELRRNAYTAFVTLPKMAPRLAYRYLFDRGSFYEGRVR